MRACKAWCKVCQTTTRQEPFELTVGNIKIVQLVCDDCANVTREERVVGEIKLSTPSKEKMHAFAS